MVWVLWRKEELLNPPRNWNMIPWLHSPQIPINCVFMAATI
jgi:hypothetical protein